MPGASVPVTSIYFGVVIASSPARHRVEEELTEIRLTRRTRREFGHAMLRNRSFDQGIDVGGGEADGRQAIRHSRRPHDLHNLGGQKFPRVLFVASVEVGAEQSGGG